jgi:hypothetical protein
MSFPGARLGARASCPQEERTLLAENSIELHACMVLWFARFCKKSFD